MEKDEQKQREQRIEQQRKLQKNLDRYIQTGKINLNLSELDLLEQLAYLINETSDKRKSSIKMLLQITHPDSSNSSTNKEIYAYIFKIVLDKKGLLSNLINQKQPTDTSTSKGRNKENNSSDSRTTGANSSDSRTTGANSSDNFRKRYQYHNEDIEFKDFINRSFEFSYPDGTKIRLKYIKKIINIDKKMNILYKYEFIGDDNIPHDFYTEFTPQELLIDLEQKNPGILMNYYLRSDRLEKIFRKICPDDLIANEYCGNGYAGYIEKKGGKYRIKSHKWGCNMAFKDQEKQFEEKMKNKPFVFKRKEDNSSFSLQFIEKKVLYNIPNNSGGIVYKYWFQDPNYNNGNRLELYIGHSPTQILEMIYKKRQNYFVDVLLGSFRLDRIFSKENDINKYPFGYGYGGFIDWENGTTIGKDKKKYSIIGIKAELVCIEQMVLESRGRNAS